MNDNSDSSIKYGEQQINIKGTVERITYQNTDNGFTVLRVKSRGYRELLTVVGYASVINGGEFIEAVGEWKNNVQYGQQLVASSIKVLPPTTVEGMKKYLASGMIKGIGTVYGERLVEYFGLAVFDIIEDKPHRLLEVEGIGQVRQEKIIEGWQTQKKIKEIMMFLYENGVGTAKAVRIYKKYGDLAITVIKDNPYRLAQDIHGIGFKTADALAMRMGIAKDSHMRAKAGINFMLLEEVGNGHCGYPREKLLAKSAEILEIPADIIEQAALADELEQNIVADDIANEECLFLPWLYSFERSIAEIFLDLAKGTPAWTAIDTELAIPWVEKKLSIDLAEKQKEAVAQAVNSKLMVITGGPGVGKTTIIKSIIRILAAKKIDIMLAAPTGRAAKRLSESTGREAKTIHRLLEYDPIEHRFKRNADNPLPCHLLIVDECSMVDVQLMYLLLKAVSKNTALLLVGDVNQLPSVGAGQVLADIIESTAVPVVVLNEIFRQARTSKIVTSAHAINSGLFPDISNEPNSDFYFVAADDPEQAMQKIIMIVKQRIPQRWQLDALSDVQVLCPANIGGIGVRSLNVELQKALNGNSTVKVERFGVTYARGDKVMQIENNYDKEVFNGDIGYIRDINSEDREMIVCFDNREVLYEFDELDELVLAYACTIHKSQGSEYPAVVIPILMQHYIMLQRNLIYTAVTRGKQLVVLVGQKKALHFAIKGKNHNKQRYSKLREWLQKGK